MGYLVIAMGYLVYDLLINSFTHHNRLERSLTKCSLPSIVAPVKQFTHKYTNYLVEVIFNSYQPVSTSYFGIFIRISRFETSANFYKLPRTKYHGEGGSKKFNNGTI